MPAPIQITFRHMDGSPALQARIRELAQRLARFSASIVGCHVTVELPHRHHHQGNLFGVKIDITVPGGEIAIRHAHPQNRAHEDVYVALRDAFQAATRKLQNYERKRRQFVEQRGARELQASTVAHDARMSRAPASLAALARR